MRLARRPLFVAVSLACLGLFVACRTLVPIAEVHDAPLLTTPHNTLDQVTEAIGVAALSLGWDVEKQAPGVMQATLRLRNHVAVVRIEYDTRTFSILPVETQNIKREGDLIHPNYNGWIQNLQRRISSTPVAEASVSPPRVG
jgi:hypothetical protein